MLRLDYTLRQYHVHGKNTFALFFDNDDDDDDDDNDNDDFNR